MKKIFSSLFVIAILTMVTFGGTIQAYANTYEDESDIVFLKTLEKIIVDEGIVENRIDIAKESIYDISLNQLGYIYIIKIGNVEGYALCINTDGFFDIAEIYTDAENPYQSYDGTKIYVSLFCYLVWDNENFIETSTGLPLTSEIVNKLAEKAFCASGDPLYFSEESFTFLNKSQNTFELTKRHPAYYPIGVSNACTPAAGGNIIGFYTRYYPELILGFSPGSFLGTYYLYKEMASEATPVIQTLYSYMGTNATEPGTTISGFKNGMTRYCYEKGRNISYSSCMQSGNFNYETAKLRLAENKPLVLFLDTFTVGTLLEQNGTEYITYTVGTLCHAITGFGYKEITYTLTNGKIRTDKYIQVATGLVSHTKGFFNINYKTQIDEVYAVNIY